MMENGNKGFTLIELVTVIVVLAILAGFTFSFMDNAVRTYLVVREQDKLYSEGTYIMERIVRELNDASLITEPAGTGTTGHTLTFARSHPSETVTFDKTGRNLKRNNTALGSNIKTFSVTLNAAAGGAFNESITILLELDSPSHSAVPAFSLSTTVAPNNFAAGNYTERSFGGNYYENIK